MKTLLVAVRAEDRDQALIMAAQEFRVCLASTVKEATSMLAAIGMDGVVCGMHFNEGDPFEFLRQMRRLPTGANLPFIVVKGGDGLLHPQSYLAVKMACDHEGVPYLDAGALIQQHGVDIGHAKLRQRINELLSDTHKQKNAAA